MVKVSIIMPVFNNYDYLETAVQSLINQTYDDFEVIIVDDCSTDVRNEDIYKKLEKFPAIKIIRNKINQGITKSKIIGLSNASGQYIGWLASDDVYELSFIEENMKVIEEFPNALIFSKYKFMNEFGQFLYTYDKIPYFLPEKQIINNKDFRLAIYHFYKNWDMFINYDTIFGDRKFFEGDNAFWEGTREHEDLYHLLHVALVKKIDFVYLNKALVNYRQHSKQTTFEAKERHRNNYMMITAKIQVELNHVLDESIC